MQLLSLVKIYNKLDFPLLKFLIINTLRIFRLRFLVVRLDTNYACNLKCRMCYFSNPNVEKRKPMSLELFKNIADDIFDRTRVLYLSCAAEPFMTKNFIDFIKTARNYNIPFISFCTNGTLLSEPVIQEIVDLRVNEVIVSLDGSTPATYENIRRGAKFETVVENIRLFKKIKHEKKQKEPRLRLNYLLMKSTVGELEPFFDLIKELNISYVNFREMLPFKTGDPDHYAKESILSDPHIYNDIITSINKKSKEIGVEAVTSIGCQKQVKKCAYRMFECLFPWFALWIDSNGKFKPCAYYGYIGDFTRDSYWNSIKGKEVEKIKQDLFLRPQNSCLKKCIHERGLL